MFHEFVFVWGEDSEGNEGFIHRSHATTSNYPNAITRGLLLSHDIYEHYKGKMVTVEDELIALGGIRVVRTADWEWPYSLYKVLAVEVEALMDFALHRGIKPINIRMTADEKEEYEWILDALRVDPVHINDTYYVSNLRMACKWVIYGMRLKTQEYKRILQRNNYAPLNAFEELKRYTDEVLFKDEWYHNQRLYISNNTSHGITLIRYRNHEDKLIQHRIDY